MRESRHRISHRGHKVSFNHRAMGLPPLHPASRVMSETMPRATGGKVTSPLGRLDSASSLEIALAIEQSASINAASNASAGSAAPATGGSVALSADHLDAVIKVSG